jgi:hypothetical protein
MLTREEWGRVLSEAEALTVGLEARKDHLKREYQGLEEPSRLDARLAQADAEGRRFLRDRIEVHIGTIQVMRPIRAHQGRLVPIPPEIRQGIAKLIGSDAVRSLSEVETWQR